MPLHISRTTGPTRNFILGKASVRAAASLFSITPRVIPLRPTWVINACKSSGTIPSVIEFKFSRAAWAVLNGWKATRLTTDANFE